VDALAGVALVCVLAQIVTLCDLEGFGGDDLVERVGGAGELFAGVAVAGMLLAQHMIRPKPLRPSSNIGRHE
jgi:hypothetical protein